MAGSVTLLSPSQDPQTSRTLTLISKTIQTLGSLSKSKSVSHIQHMGSLLCRGLRFKWALVRDCLVLPTAPWLLLWVPPLLYLPQASLTLTQPLAI